MSSYIAIQKSDGSTQTIELKPGFNYTLSPGESVALVDGNNQLIEIPTSQNGRDLIIDLGENTSASITDYFDHNGSQTSDSEQLEDVDDSLLVSLSRESADPVEDANVLGSGSATQPDDSFTLIRASTTGYINFNDPNSSFDNFGFNEGFEGAAPNDLPPSINPDTGFVSENESLTLDLLSNDTDPEGSLLRITSIEGSTSNLITLPSGATVIRGNGGSVTYEQGDLFNSLPVGETAIDSFTYTIIDDGGNEVTSEVNVVIEGVNDDPTAVDEAITGSEDDPISIDVLTNDTDPDSTDVLTVVAVDEPLVGTIDFSPEGVVTLNPGNDFDHLSEGETEVVTVDYTISDPHGVTDTAEVTFTVTGVNDNPVALDDLVEIDEDTPIIFDPRTNDTDVEDDPLEVTEINGNPVAPGLPVTLPSGVTVTLQPDGTLAYDPNGQFEDLGTDQTATDTYTYTVDDGNGGTDIASVTVTIQGVNDGPVAIDDEAFTNEDTVVTVPLTANDLDAEDGVPVVQEVAGQPFVPNTPITLPSGAVITPDANGVVEYNPNGQFESLNTGETAVETFSYTVVDSEGATAVATSSVTILGINDSPDAVDDIVTIGEDNPATIVPLANDTDPENQALTITEVNGSPVTPGFPVTLPSGVTVTLQPDGTFSYDPNGQFEDLGSTETAVDTYSYTIDDGNGGTDIASITVTIQGSNDGPVAVDDDEATTEDAPVLGWSLIGNDSDAEDGIPQLQEIAGQPVIPGNPITLPNGTIVIPNANGEISYDPNNQFESLNTGETAVETFNYTVVDSEGATAVATATIVVSGINDGPDAVDDTVAIGEDNPVTINVLGNDTDPENQPLSITEVNGSPLTPRFPVTLPSGVELTLQPNGTFSYNPNGQFEDLSSTETVIDTYTYTIDDGNGGTDIASVTVTIQGSNDGPVAVDDTGVTNENDPITGLSLLGNDTDAEDGVPQLQQIGGQAIVPGVPITLPNGAVVTPDANGNIDYDPNGQFESLNTGETAIETFTYTVVDSEGATSTATTTITVTGSNDSPDAVDDNDSTNQNTVANIAVISNDSDPENQPLSVVQIEGQPVAIGVPATLPSGATVVVQPNGTIDYNPNGQYDDLAVGQSDVDTFAYTISDGNGGTDIATVTVTIDGLNDGPDAIDDGFTVPEDATVTYDLTVNDTDPDSDPLAVSQINGANLSPGASVTLPSGAIVTLNPNGTVAYDPNDQFELPVGQTAVDSFTYQVSDGNGGFDTATANITIDGTNDPPTALDDFSLGNTPGRPVVFDVTANDSDIDGTIDPTTVDLDPSSPGITTTLDVPGEGVWQTDGNGLVTFTPDPALQGNPTAITYTVSDNDGLQATANGELTLTYANFDLWFGNDLSGSVDNSEYAQSRVLISGLADSLPFDESNGVKAGLFSWAQTGAAVLNQDITADDVQFVDTALTYPRPFGGGTNIDFAINFGVQQIQNSLQPGGGGRSYADQVLVILTDASPASQIVAPSAAIIAAADAAKAAGITLAFIAIQEAQSTQAALDVLTQASSLDAAGDPLLLTAPTYAGIDQAQILDIIEGLAPQHANNIINTPILALGDQEVVAEDGIATLDPLSNDNHVSNDQLTITEIDTIPVAAGGTVTLASGAVITLNNDGTISYDTNGQFGALNTGDAQIDQFEYTVIDQSGNTETALIGVVVEGNSAVPPVVIDLDGDGAEFVGVDEGIQLDVDGDGVKEQTAWAGSDDAVLVFDENGNNQVDGPSEFAFASYSDDPNATDLEGLRHFDTNNNGSLDAGDEQFSDFQLWQDANGDGESDENEMLSLLEAGIESISLTSDGNEYTAANGDVTVHGEAVVEYSDGTTGVAADAEFNFEEIFVSEEQSFEVAAEDGSTIDLNASTTQSTAGAQEPVVLPAPPTITVDDNDLI